jgi:hypothetical protein
VKRKAAWYESLLAAMGCSKTEALAILFAVGYVGAHVVRAKLLGLL